MIAIRYPHAWAAIAILVMSASNPATAQKAAGVLSLRKFELLDAFAGAQQSEELNSYLSGVADSLSLANRFLEGDRKPKLFCLEGAPSVAQLRNILRERIKQLALLGQNSEQAKERIGVAIVIIQKLREAYPCR